MSAHLCNLKWRDSTFLCFSKQSINGFSNLREWFKREALVGDKKMRNLLLTVILIIIHLQKNATFAASKLLDGNSSRSIYNSIIYSHISS